MVKSQLFFLSHTPTLLPFPHWFLLLHQYQQELESLYSVLFTTEVSPCKMSTTKPFSIPEHVSSLMDTNRQQALSQIRGRSVSNSSRLWQISQDSHSTASDFLDAKIAALSDEQDYLICVQQGLSEALHSKKITPDMYEKESGTVLKSFLQGSQILRVMKRQHKLLLDDLEEAVEQ